MADLKFGGSDVKIMYGDREIGGATKLEPGTILHFDSPGSMSSDLRLIGATNKWDNINGISFEMYNLINYSKLAGVNITGDDFKNLDKEKTYDLDNYATLTIFRTIVSGEYRLSYRISSKTNAIYLVKAL